MVIRPTQKRYAAPHRKGIRPPRKAIPATNVPNISTVPNTSGFAPFAPGGRR
jgi:hypothetical protein